MSGPQRTQMCFCCPPTFSNKVSSPIGISLCLHISIGVSSFVVVFVCCPMSLCSFVFSKWISESPMYARKFCSCEQARRDVPSASIVVFLVPFVYLPVSRRDVPSASTLQQKQKQRGREGGTEREREREIERAEPEVDSQRSRRDTPAKERSNRNRDRRLRHTHKPQLRRWARKPWYQEAGKQAILRNTSPS